MKHITLTVPADSVGNVLALIGGMATNIRIADAPKGLPGKKLDPESRSGQLRSRIMQVLCEIDEPITGKALKERVLRGDDRDPHFYAVIDQLRKRGAVKARKRMEGRSRIWVIDPVARDTVSA